MHYTKIIIIIFVILFSYSCSNSTEIETNTPPTAIFSYAPGNADTTTIFTFDASESNDNEDAKGLLQFKWDLDGKHNWTDAVNNPIINYKYSKAGTYIVGLKVIDTEGWSGETTKTIIVKDTL